MTDLDRAADELYGGAPGAFVARRAELVRQARARRDRPLANAIQALRRPTRTAWLVNLLARQATAEVAALLDLAEALRNAQTRGDGSALRTLSAQRRQQIDALTRRAVALGREHQHPPPEASVGEVAATLQAALADPEIADQVRRGRLATGTVYGGFGPAVSAPNPGNDEDLVTVLAASIPVGVPTPQPDEEAARRQQERREYLAGQRDATRTALDEAQREAGRATEHADTLAQQVDRLRGELARAEQAEERARTAARSARERVREFREAADAAERAWSEAEAGGG